MQEDFTFLGLYDPVSTCLHLVAALGFLIAGYFLVSKALGSKMRVSSVILYTISLIFLFSMSGTFHLLPYHSSSRDVLQVLDHAAIWILIAGTFTPIHTLMFRGVKRWGVLLLVWSITIPSVIFTTVFFSTMPEWLSLIFYLGLGWIGLLTGYFVVRQYGFKEAKYLVLGGLAYTFGAVLEFLRWPVLIEGIVEAHDFFHVFVIFGAGLHWYFIYQHAHWPVYKRQIFLVKHDYKRSYYKAKTKSDTIEVHATSLEELKEKIHEAITLKYDRKFPIEQVTLQFIEEEDIYYKVPIIKNS
ncbi:MAG TPA: DNA-binding protein [Sulfurimonas sp.]|nr:DNA-binding protein [Sulfurimonas sp.]